jgi:arabinogalactan oligomer/maltooligosaccharide transport system permease protein
MSIALLLNMSFKGRGIMRTIFMLPWAVPTFAAAFIWQWMFDYRYGAINHVLKFQGFAPIHWTISPFMAALGLIIAHVWKLMPWTIAVLLAGLQLIPKEIEEAAKIDGANKRQQFWYITLPYMRYVILIVVLLRTIWTFNWFDFVYLITAGGPAKSTLILPIKLYNDAFVSYTWNIACAQGTVMFLILFIFIIFYFRILSKEEAV